MSKRLKISAILTVIAVAILSVAVANFGVYAKSESELSASITNKVKYTNLFRCYDNIHSSIETLNFNSASDLFAGGDSTLVAPEGWSGVSGRCSDLVNGMIGSVPSDQSSRGQVLQKLGYSGGGSSSRCVWFEYSKFTRTGAGGYSESKIATDKVCASVAADGTMSNYQRDNAAGEPYNIVTFDGTQLVANYEDKIGGGLYEMYVQGYNNNWDSFVSAYANKINSMNGQSSFLGANGTTDTYYGFSSCGGQSGACTEDVSAGSGSYVISNRSTAASIAASNYLKLSNGNFTTAEKVSLYQFYLKNNSSSIVCNPTDTPDTTVARKVKLVINSKYYENCYAIERDPGTTSVHAVDGSFSLTNTINYDGIINALNSMTATTDREGIIDPGATIGAETGTPTTPDPTTPDPGSGGETSDATDACYGSPGALGLSWILCPVLSGLSNTLNYFYGSITEDYIQIKPALVEENSGTYQAWHIFQNIANIILVILLLVVIFSQLTGVGIDNYGIKKILPRLIICAILINLSYFIMQFLVDISNIIGNSIGGLFNMAGANIEHTNIVGASTDGNIPENIIGLGAIIGTAGGIAALVANPAILLSFLLVLLSGVIAVIMMWLILIARQAGVVIAVVVAPVAFAMYLLPNTSKTTKSWTNLVKSLLLLYPLSAFLIGASFFASDLLAGLDSSGNMILPAMLLRVIPFFALPALFRKSVDAMGNIGTRIQGFGRGLSRGTAGAMRNADWYKNAQERGMERRTRLRAGIDREGNEATGWRGLLRSRSNRNRARYRSQYLKNQSEQDKAEMLNDQGYMEAMQRKQEFEAAEAMRDATKYTQDGYIEGKEAQGRLSRENEIEGARLYTTPGFEGSKREQYATSRQSELRKMFMDQYANDNAAARRNALHDLLANHSNDANAAARAEALFDSLMESGDRLELLESLSRYTDENGVFQNDVNIAGMNAGVRTALMARAAKSGDPLLKGWARSVNNGVNVDLSNYITGNGADSFNGWLNTRGGANALDNADKDTFRFLAANNGAQAFLAGGAGQNNERALSAFANASAAAGSQNPQASDAIRAMINDIRGTNAAVFDGISSRVSAENVTRMNNTVAEAYGPGALRDVVMELNRPENAELRAKVSGDVKGTLGIR